MPFKLNQDRCHHILRQRFKVTNWPDYEAGLRQRGSLTVWFTEETIAAWTAEPRTTRGGQSWYSPLAILTALTLRAVFRLAFRPTEGLIGWHRQLPASIAYCSRRSQLAVARAGQRGDPGLKIARNLANVG